MIFYLLFTDSGKNLECFISRFQGLYKKKQVKKKVYAEVDVLQFVMNLLKWYVTISAIACVSAAEPDRQQ